MWEKKQAEQAKKVSVSFCFLSVLFSKRYMDLTRLHWGHRLSPPPTLKLERDLMSPCTAFFTYTSLLWRSSQAFDDLLVLTLRLSMRQHCRRLFDLDASRTRAFLKSIIVSNDTAIVMTQVWFSVMSYVAVLLLESFSEWWKKEVSLPNNNVVIPVCLVYQSCLNYGLSYFKRLFWSTVLKTQCLQQISLHAYCGVASMDHACMLGHEQSDGFIDE